MRSRPSDIPSIVVEMECPLCNREWVTVMEEGTEKLECPSCHYMVVTKNHEILE